jgi:hypothetical protein
MRCVAVDGSTRTDPVADVAGASLRVAVMRHPGILNLGDAEESNSILDTAIRRCHGPLRERLLAQDHSVIRNTIAVFLVLARPNLTFHGVSFYFLHYVRF